MLALAEPPVARWAVTRTRLAAAKEKGAEQPDRRKEIGRRRDNRDRSRHAIGEYRDIQVGRIGHNLNGAG